MAPKNRLTHINQLL